MAWDGVSDIFKLQWEENICKDKTKYLHLTSVLCVTLKKKYALKKTILIIISHLFPNTLLFFQANKGWFIQFDIYTYLGPTLIHL